MTPLQWCGYTLALAGVSWYNYVRIIAAKAQPAGDAVKDVVKDKVDRRPKVDVEVGEVGEKQGLLSAYKGSGEAPGSPLATQRPNRQQ